MEDLHVKSGIENDIDNLIINTSKDKLRRYAGYCNCQDQETFSQFCKKVVAKYLSGDLDEVGNTLKEPFGPNDEFSNEGDKFEVFQSLRETYLALC